VEASELRRPAGGFAARRYRHRQRAWLKRNWWAFVLLGLAPICGVALLAAPFGLKNMAFAWGFAVGCAIAAPLVFAGFPPSYIARWRRGAEGEKATSRALRRLVGYGWTLVNDVPLARGNIDHVLVGPPGVFALDSKNLNGIVSVRHGVLKARWHEDPDDGYENKALASRSRAAARELCAALQAQRVAVDVQPVIVLWAEFEQRSILSKDVAWIDGRHLADVLQRRPATLSQESATQVVAALESWLSAIDDRAN